MNDIIKGEGYTQRIEGDDSMFVVYTIGHSNHSPEEFLRLLQIHSITCVADVRSIPASKHSPQFNQDVLEAFLNHHHINYQFFGREFGARRTDSYNQQGQVDFEFSVKTELFQQWVKLIKLDFGITVEPWKRINLRRTQIVTYSDSMGKEIKRLRTTIPSKSEQYNNETKKRYNRICFMKTFWYFRRFLLKTFA